MRILTSTLIFLILLSCDKKTDTQVKSYFNSNFDKSLSIQIDINDFNDYGELIKSIEKISCSDSIANLTFTKDNIKKRINVFSFCPEKIPIYDPKHRNTIYFENEKLIKNEKIFDIDSLNYILENDLKNYGENPKFAESPEKLAIIILDDNNGNLNSITLFLDKLTDIYDSIDKSVSLNVMMAEYIEIPPLPPNPNNFE
ncbi:hypothetical protein [Psychroflexus planctonicus]|uniref:hypothetical protein n=1 Tax=Psychroflexus planctonicus TaxID=1526575 RepID=UPI00188865B3|nr:hypothetical protein [Psychroflexus planctonicus]